MQQAPRLVSVESPNRLVMNTIAKIIAVGPDEKTAQASINAAFDEVYRLEKLMNRFDPNSQLSLVNRQGAKEPVKVDRDLFEILQKSIYYSKLTDGAFDITVGPLVDMWRKCAEANSIPTEQQLADVKKIIGCDKIILDANDYSVKLAVEGMRLDLGGIAKGFAADKAQAIMESRGATGGLVDLGGQIGCFGTTQNGGKWIIGIRNPSRDAADNIIMKLELSDMAASTSGNYERFYKIAGKKFSHIFNLQTEQSAELISSDTIICPNGTQSDALSTAVNIMGAAKGLELIEKIENTEAIIVPIEDKNKLIKSKGAEKFIVAD
ncbi:MAG: FAD:protein FMN transferase [Planctomycetaceae bacterium]|nr:FAD:protein FMN transferase [Planctomycetaceae bacterium]